MLSVLHNAAVVLRATGGESGLAFSQTIHAFVDRVEQDNKEGEI